MLNHNFTIRPSIALNKKLFYKTCLFSSFSEQITIVRKRPYPDNLEQENFLEKSSIRRYINFEKVNLLKPYYKPKKEFSCRYNFVIDDTTAKDIVDNILLNNKERKRIIIEGNPGLGLITYNLLNSGLSYIHIFDKSDIKDVSLTQLIAQHKKKVTVHEINMHTNPQAVILRSFDLGREQGLPVTIVGVTTSFFFIRSLVLYFINFHLWKHDFEVFLVISYSVWKAIFKNSSGLKSNVHSLFCLLFNMEEMAKYPRNSFLPSCETSSEDMTLIRITINPDFVKSIAEEDISDYFSFLGILGRKKRNFIIPTLEKWMPGCGPYLISKGVSMTMEYCELSQKEAITLFNFCKKSKEYKYFKDCVKLFH